MTVTASTCPTTNISVYSPSIAGPLPPAAFWNELIFALRALKYVSKHRNPRIDAIADQLSSSNYDIIALQEIWVFADYEKVQQRISSRLPYSKFFYR